MRSHGSPDEQRHRIDSRCYHTTIASHDGTAGIRSDCVAHVSPREADLPAKLFTRLEGRVHGAARSAKKSKPRFGGPRSQSSRQWIMGIGSSLTSKGETRPRSVHPRQSHLHGPAERALHERRARSLRSAATRFKTSSHTGRFSPTARRYNCPTSSSNQTDATRCAFDGVMQRPGAAQKDTKEGFVLGGCITQFS